MPGIFHCFLRCLYAGLIIIMVCSCHEEDIPVDEDTRSALLEQINSLRENGCTCGNEWIKPVKALTWNVTLEQAALDHATDMYLNNYFDHLSLDGTPPITRAHHAGYSGDYVGEVIARKYYTARDVVNAWKESESHCKALMDSIYNEMGGARQKDYWVVDLGKSK
jgi:uncharacterized protein YkwD